MIAMDMDDRRTLLRLRFERATEVPMLVLALLMVPVLLAPVVLDLDEGIEQTLTAVDWAIWGVFAAEFIVRFALAPHHLRFLRKEWPDVLIVVLPILRPLRIVRSARALRLLRLGRLATFLAEATVNGRRLVARHHLDLALMAAGAVVLASAGLVFALEEGTGGTIRSFGDALWWAMATVTTVGYGDTYPTTPGGRGVGVALMLTGITLFGVITANLAAYLVESRDAPGALAETDLSRQVATLAGEVARLSALLEAERAGPGRATAPPPTSEGGAVGTS